MAAEADFVVSAADTVVELVVGLRSFDCLLGILVLHAPFSGMLCTVGCMPCMFGLNVLSGHTWYIERHLPQRYCVVRFCTLPDYLLLLEWGRLPASDPSDSLDTLCWVLCLSVVDIVLLYAQFVGTDSRLVPPEVVSPRQLHGRLLLLVNEFLAS